MLSKMYTIQKCLWLSLGLARLRDNHNLLVTWAHNYIYTFVWYISEKLGCPECGPQALSLEALSVDHRH